MTVQEDAKEEPSSNGRKPQLSSISTKGLFSSLRERSDDVAGTPDSATPRSNRGIFVSTPRTPGGPLSPSILNLSPLKTNINKLLTPSRTFSRLRDEREELSRLTPSPPSRGFRDGFSLPLVGEVKPDYLLTLAKDWLRNPKNLALLFWGLAVGVSGAILFMVMVGMLDAVLPDKNARNTWFEVSNQIINALFTLMAVYLHPRRCLHLHMLCRWKPSDIVNLRDIYCKDGKRKPHEWGHMLVVVMLLQLNCIAQYALCGLNWGYRRADRPAIGVAVCLCLSLGGAAGAGIYNTVSPLGRDFDEEEFEGTSEELEKGTHDTRETLDTHVRDFTARTKIYRMLERRVSFACREGGVIVEKPEWKGGLFDCTSEPPVCLLSIFCCVCVFGWNMDRLGFGNRYVHIVTFVLICTAPFWIFDLAALNIQDRAVRNAIGGSGIILCAFGLLYGGYWRIRMRERYKLPGNRFCCGKPSVTDCFQWLFCPLCSLCQEVRTAESYEVKDDKFYTRTHIGPDTPPVPSPPRGLASPRTPGPTLAAVPEVDSLHDMKFVDAELYAHDSPFRGSHMVPPTPVTASRNHPFGSSPSVGINDVPRPPSPSNVSSSPNNKPVLVGSEKAGNNNAILESVASEGSLRSSTNNNPFLGSVVTASPPRTSSSNNPFLQPEAYSRDHSPARSPSRLSSSQNIFSPPEFSPEATDMARGSPLRSPLHSPSRLSPAYSPFTPEISSVADEKLPHPLRTSSLPQNPFLH